MQNVRMDILMKVWYSISGGDLHGKALYCRRRTSQPLRVRTIKGRPFQPVIAKGASRKGKAACRRKRRERAGIYAPRHRRDNGTGGQQRTTGDGLIQNSKAEQPGPVLGGPVVLACAYTYKDFIRAGRRMQVLRARVLDAALLRAIFS